MFRIHQQKFENYYIVPSTIEQDFVPKVCTEDAEEVISFVNNISEFINNGRLTWKWWFEDETNIN